MAENPLTVADARQQLRERVEWADGGWLGLVTTTSPGAANELIDGVEADHPGRVQALRPGDPDALADLVGEIAEARTSWDVRFVVAIWRDTAWDEGWTRLLTRLNAVRDRTLTSGGGLVLVADLPVKELIQRVAPDLWSVRTWAGTLEATPVRQTLHARPATFAQLAGAGPDARVEPLPPPGPGHRARLREVAALRRAGRPEEALARAREAVRLSKPSRRLDALILLTELEVELGVQVEEHLTEVLDLASRAGVPPRRLLRLCTLLVRCGLHAMVLDLLDGMDGSGTLEDDLLMLVRATAAVGYGELVQAETWYRRVTHPPLVGVALTGIAAFQLQSGRWTEAESAASRAVAHLEDRVARSRGEHDALIQALEILAVAARARRDAHGLEQIALRGLTVARSDAERGIFRAYSSADRIRPS